MLKITGKKRKNYTHIHINKNVLNKYIQGLKVGNINININLYIFIGSSYNFPLLLRNTDFLIFQNLY